MNEVMIEIIEDTGLSRTDTRAHETTGYDVVVCRHANPFASRHVARRRLYVRRDGAACSLVVLSCDEVPDERRQ